MPPPYCYDHPRPSVTVDLVVFGLDGEGLKVLLIRRKKDPFAARWAIPGGFLDLDEPIEVGARRELREEAGVEPSGPVDLIGVFGDPGRDPRGRVISLAHATALRAPLPEVQGGDDAAEAAWLDPRHVSGLAFDHDEILARALAWLSRGVADGPIGLALLPVEFGDEDVKRLQRTLTGSVRGAVNWRKAMEKGGRIITLGGEPPRFRTVGL